MGEDKVCPRCGSEFTAKLRVNAWCPTCREWIVYKEV